MFVKNSVTSTTLGHGCDWWLNDFHGFYFVDFELEHAESGG